MPGSAFKGVFLSSKLVSSSQIESIQAVSLNGGEWLVGRGMYELRFTSPVGDSILLVNSICRISSIVMD